MRKRGVGVFDWYGLIGLIAILFSLNLVSSIGFDPSKTISYLQEEQSPIFQYNFTANTTYVSGDLPLTFYIRNITSNVYPLQTATSFYSWFNLNSSSGVMSINSTLDNQTGRFNVTLEVLDKTLGTGSIDLFYFIVNSTNDAPNFTSVANEYNLTQDHAFIQYLNGSDEERMYPLTFNVTFVNCSLASFSTRNNCSLINPLRVSNTSATLNFTPSRNDVGVYYANFSVMDAASNYATCNSTYCSPDYFINKTTYYSQIVTFNVFSNFEVNISDCQNKVFQENSLNTCNITIYSKGQNDSLNLSTYAYLKNFNVAISNRNWFYANTSLNSENFSKTIVISLVPNKTEVGNWTINFTARDLTYNQSATESINLFVNRTDHAVPNFVDVSNLNTSINLLTTINLIVYDNDFLIPDKNANLGGFNESINFAVKIFNGSNPGQEVSIANFVPTITNMPVSGTNKTLARISFTPSLSEAGNYTVNITASDSEGLLDTTQFNLIIASNSAPLWSNTLVTNFVSYEGNNTYLNLSQNVSDPESDSITFSYSNDTQFSSFSLSSLGIINFTSGDVDVGQHLVTILVTDKWGLSNQSIFNFTIYNVDDRPYIRAIESGDVTNGTFVDNFLNCSEGDLVKLRIWVEDDDYKIPVAQRAAFYNENLSLDLNITGPNNNLFYFSRDSSFPTTGNNLSKFNTTFIPTRTDIGNYNITINITDQGNLSRMLSFNLSAIVFQNDPILITLSNKSTAVGRNLVYWINATDDEDGSSNIIGGNINFTFSYLFLNGSDFIMSNQSVFNTTTGLLNYTFNSSQGGNYHIRITVNDSTNRQDSDDFFIKTYDVPSLNYPASDYEFFLSENQTYNFTFQLNHSVNNNLTYKIYTYTWSDAQNEIYNGGYGSNNTNLTFEFTPNFNNETYVVKNVTLIAYPADLELENRELINLTTSWDLTVNHTNSPLNFSSNIGGSDGIISGHTPQSLSLRSYFQDIDASDFLHNQTISFIYNVITGGCPMNVIISNWTNESFPFVNFSSSYESICNFSILGLEYDESNSSNILNVVESNNFSVELSTEVVVITNTVTTTTTSPKSVSLKVVTPGPVSAYPFQTLNFPIVIENNGKYPMSSIDITTLVFKDKVLTDLVDVMLDKKYIESLNPGEKGNITMTLLIKTNNTGSYEVLINATSARPLYNDWGKVYFDLGEINESDVKKYLLFAEEFLSQNSQCIELKEYIKDAYNYFNEGDYGDARLKAEAAVNSCKNMLAQGKEIPKQSKPQINFIFYFVISMFLAFGLGITYYLVKRDKIRRGTTVKIYGD